MKETGIIKYYGKKYIMKEILCGILYLFFIGASLVGPLLMQYFIDEILVNGVVADIGKFALVFMAVYIGMAVLAILIRYTIVNLENGIITDVRHRMFSHVVYQPMDYFKTHSMGAVVERIVRDAEVIRSLWGFLFPSIFSSVLTFIVTFIIIFSISKMIAVLTLAAIGIYVFVFRYYNEKLRTLYWKTREDTDGINTCINDSWSGAKEIKVFQFEKSMIGKFFGFLNILKKDNRNMAIKEEYSNQFMGLATTCGTLITLCFGGYYVLKGDLTIGTLVALQAYVAKLYAPAQNIADMAVDYKKYSVNMSRMNEILDLEQEELGEIHDSDLVNSKLSFRDISFSYGEQEVLNKVSFDMPEKGIVALAGKSGAGKSTIINLLLGFIKKQEGHIFFGNRNIEEIPLEDIRRSVTMVSQDTYLFRASIYENIKIGNQEATDDEIQAVVNKLGIDKIVEQYPNKLNTVISEFGKNLSGGQVQRISIARALLKKASIVIFDEATSNIDSQTELMIQETINEMKKNSLVILVSHRLSSLKNADEIYVLQEGSIVEKGSFEKLKNQEGAFHHLFAEQML